MARYRKKVVEVDAFKWMGEVVTKDEPEWFSKALREGRLWIRKYGPSVMLFLRNCDDERSIEAKVGDYILRHRTGRLEVMPPDKFTTMFELIKE